MGERGFSGLKPLNLHKDELIEVRSEGEILATLDANGELDCLPFMPEMLRFCGKRYRVYRRADKTCDTINHTGIRRLKNCVHLELRCEGEAHGGCQARCLIFWKEAWLKRVAVDATHQLAVEESERAKDSSSVPSDDVRGGRCTTATLTEKTQQPSQNDTSPEPRYSCQATELFRATEPLSPRKLGPYIQDLRCGNITLRELLRGALFAAFRKLVKIGGYRFLTGCYDRVQRLTGGCPYPYKEGTLTTTPTATLNLRAGELVRIKDQDEILKTVNKQNRNRGLTFDPEMVPYCGGEYRVLQRIERIINERTGKMIYFTAPPVMLEGVFCKSQFSEGKLFCPRSIYSYWREIWLTRAEVSANERPSKP
jgi:hypothetical protein